MKNHKITFVFVYLFAFCTLATVSTFADENNTLTFLPMIVRSNPSRITNVRVVAECVCSNGVSVTDDSCAPEDTGVRVHVDFQYKGPTVDSLYIFLDPVSGFSDFVPPQITGPMVTMVTDASGTYAEGSNWELWVRPYRGYGLQQDEITSSQLLFQFVGYLEYSRVELSNQQKAFKTFDYNWTEQSCTP